ncbi:MAG: exodeoxyribonuclease VII small subunit [Clostridiales bacterium]|nr:exodeoxyribonuclease VII small subunit [Clostridiales bacterium]
MKEHDGGLPALEEIDFERALGRLEEIVRKLEAPDAKLADSLALFEEGVRLTAHCNQLLDVAEQKVTMLAEGEGGALQRIPMPPIEDRRGGRGD